MKIIYIGAFLITIITTPWVNSDALIIPKLILLVALGSYFLPIIIVKYKSFIKNSRLKILIIISILFTIQMVLVMVSSEAPFEQEFFGRTGRGLGFLTYFSLLIVMLAVALNIKYYDIEKFSLWILLSALFSSMYSIMQFFGVDFADWRTQTNGIIGTIGNPNFQSSFVALAFFPSLIYLWKKKLKIFFIISMLIFLYTLYICESTQGYVALITSTFIYLLFKLWFSKKHILFYLTGIGFLATAIISSFWNVK